LSTSYDDGVESSKTWEHNTAAMLRMDWNLFNGGSDTAEREAAMYRVRQTKADRNELMRMVDEEIEATWSRYETAISKISNYGDALKYNRETLSMYMDQFTVGQRSLLDVLDAENELFQTSGLLVTAQANEVIAAFRILALGGKMTESLGVDPALYTDPANKIM
jgi:adhesin transport system outer membrane protein